LKYFISLKINKLANNPNKLNQEAIVKRRKNAQALDF